jgi:hypothetical protein
MDNKLNYQQARSVRSQSLKDVIADELIRGKGLGSSITGAISLKTQARMKGIKEKFDPLNIIKFLTFGSRLGPALYGRLFGRSQKDIEYFAGRAKPIGRGKQKLVKDRTDDGDEDTSGMKTVLNQMLTFMKKSREDDLLMYEKENNLKESNKLHEEKRHKDLLKALSGIKREDTVTDEKPKEGDIDFSGFLKGLMESVKKMISSVLTGIEELKNKIKRIMAEFADIWGSLRDIQQIRKLFNILSPLFTASGVFALVAFEGYLYKKFKDWLVQDTLEQINKAAAEGKTNRVEALWKSLDLRYYDLPMDIYGGGNTQQIDEVSVNQRTKQSLKQEADKGNQKAKESLEKLNREEQERKQEYIKNLKLPEGQKPTPAQLRDAERYSIGMIDLSGGTTPSELESFVSKKVTEALEKWYTPPPAGTPEAERYQKFFEDRERMILNKGGAFKPSNPLFPDATTVPNIKNETDIKKPVVLDKVSSVNNLINENIDLKLIDSTSSIQKNKAAQEKINSASTKVTSSQSIPMPLSRNQDSTYNRMLYNSIRVV